MRPVTHLLAELGCDRLLPLDAERIYRVQQVDRVLVGEPSHERKRHDEVALDLKRRRAVVERL